MSCTNTDSCNREECSYRIGLAIVLTIGLCLRIAYFAEQYRQPLFRVPLVDARYNDYLARGFAFGDWSLRGDETDYLDSPEVFVRARPFFRPPGYAFFLAILYKVTRGSVTVVLALQMALGVLNAWLAGVLARRLFGPRAAIFCAGLMATYWPFIYFETQLEEATFMTLLMLLLVRQIWLLARVTSLPNALTAGLQIGLLALTRPNAVLILPVIVAWLLWLGAKSCPFDVSVRASLALLGAAALAIAPVTIRNWLVGGEFVLISANTGVNFYIGNHEGATGFFVTDTPEFERFETSFDYPRVVRTLEQRIGRPLSFRGASRYLTTKALAFIRKNPDTFMRLTCKRTAVLWGPREVGHNREITLDRQASHVLSVLPVDFPLALTLSLVGITALVCSAFRAGIPAPIVSFSPETPRVVPVLVAIAVTYMMSFSIFFITALFRLPCVPFLIILGSYCVVFWPGVWQHASRHTALWWTVFPILLYATARTPLVALEPDRVKWHYDRGLAAQLAGDDQQALREYERVVQLAPHEFSAHANIGTLLARHGWFADALAHFRTTLAAQPSNLLALRGASVCSIMLGRADAAIVMLNTALDPEHANFRVLQLLGIASGELGKHEESLMYLRKAADVAPGRPDVSFNMHHVLVLVGAAEADTLQQGREKVPTGWFVTPRGFLIAPDW